MYVPQNVFLKLLIKNGNDKTSLFVLAVRSSQGKKERNMAVRSAQRGGGLHPQICIYVFNATGVAGFCVKPLPPYTHNIIVNKNVYLEDCQFY